MLEDVRVVIGNPQFEFGLLVSYVNGLLELILSVNSTYSSINLYGFHLVQLKGKCIDSIGGLNRLKIII